MTRVAGHAANYRPDSVAPTRPLARRLEARYASAPSVMRLGTAYEAVGYGRATFIEIPGRVPGPARAPTAARDPLDFGGLLAPNLWTIVRESDVPRAAAALLELIEREDPDVVRFLTEELKRDQVPLEILVHAVQRVRVRDAAEQQALALAVLSAAQRVPKRNPKTDSLLWALLRRYVTLAEDADLNALEEFMRPPYPPRTWQVAFQCIQNRLPRGEGDVGGVLAARAAEVFRKYSDPDIQASSENASILANAFLALAVLDSSGALHAVRSFVETSASAVQRMVARHLEGLSRRGSSRAAEVLAGLRRLADQD